MTRPVEIAGRPVGPGAPCFVIAEAGVNHNGDADTALRLVEAAADAGADAVKFQSFVAADLVTAAAPKAAYQERTTGAVGGQLEMLEALELTVDDHRRLKAACAARGVVYLCTPYEEASADMLERLDVAAYKIASTDTTNLPFLRHVAARRRPVILSTGMASLGEAEAAVETLRAHGADGRIVVLHCTSEYPAPFASLNLRAMDTMARAFGCPVGFSDHTPGVGAAPWAVALGACMVEKHFTLDRNLPGPDHRASMEPAELAELVATLRRVEAALGDGVKRPAPVERENRERMRKSLVARRPIAAGAVICAADLTAKRPGTGLDPAWSDRVAGRRAARDIPVDGIVTLACVDWSDAPGPR